MFHKFGKKFGKFRVPTRRRRRRDGSRVLGSILWRERASCCSAVVARCGAGRWPAARRRRVRILGRGASVRLQMVGLGATRPCVLDGRREPQMLAAWRRPPRGAPTGPRCPGRMCSGRPYEAADTCCGRARAQRPSGEHGLRGVARAFFFACLRGRELFLLLLPNPSPTSRSQESAPDLTMTPPKVLMVRMIQARMRGVECARGRLSSSAGRVIVSRSSGAPELLNLDYRAHFQHISRRRHMQVRGEFSHMGCPWAVRAAVRPLRSEPERTLLDPLAVEASCRVFLRVEIEGFW